MKYFWYLFVFFSAASVAIAAGYDMKLPVEGNSIANDSLQFNVMKDIYRELALKNPYCFDYSVSNTQIVQYPYDVKKKDDKYIKGFWKELWTIDVCSAKIQVPVSYSINNGSAAYKIENNMYSQ